MKAVSFGRLAVCLCAGALLAGCGTLRQGQNGMPSVSPLTYVYGLSAIYSFNGDPDGQQPNSNLVARSSNPVVIGTTEYGGAYNAGSVYGISKSKQGGWTESILYSLTGSDGWRPNGIMVPQVLDGTEPAAVTSFQGGAHGAGAIAILKPNASGAWTLSSTYSFSGQADGGGPQGAVVADSYGNLYGTTGGGGHQNHGVVYQLHPNGSTYKEKVLYSFHGRRDGVVPEAGLIMDSTGALYGTTLYGGKSNAYKGTVFKLTPNTRGYTESIVYSFKGPPDGSEPVARLCLDSSGTLYGTTSLGGKNNAGTVFSLVPSGSGYAEHVLWSFGSGSADGAYPDGNVIVDSNGVIYGTTLGNSGSGEGTLFTLKGRRERLYYFDGYDGGDPVAAPAADAKGNIFVAASALGAHRDGTVAIAHVRAGTLTCE